VKFLSAPKRNRAWYAISIAMHVVIIGAFFSIVFSYPLGQLMGIREPQQERIQYIAVPKATESSGGRSSAAKANAAPARLVAPPVTPTQLPVPNLKVDAVPARAAGGEGDGFGVEGWGLATGIVPRAPDPRIRLASPDMVYRMPRSAAEEVDSILDMAVGIAIDTLEKLQREGKLPEWVKTTKNGGQWGLTPQYIALGKLRIPTALLALLPLNMGPSQSPIDVRRAAWIRQDILENAQRSISEDEFRASVKRIRERKEREKKDKAAKDKQPDVKAPDPRPIPANQIP
jgi:hypothetical protein